MVATVDLPDNLKISDRTDPYLDPVNRSGGMSPVGIEQVVGSFAAVWRWRVVIPINNVGKARAWRVVRAQLAGRRNYLAARVCDQYRITRKDIGAVYDGDIVPHSDGTYFSDGTGYTLTQPRAALSAAASRDSGQILLPQDAFSGAMTAGVWFSIDGFLYLVTEWETEGTDYRVTFFPNLRKDQDAGDVADFDAKALWNLESDSEGILDLRGGRLGTVELRLVEALGRAV